MGNRVKCNILKKRDMKNKIILIILSICLLTSCSDFLDRNSLEGLSGEGFWTTEENAINGVNAIYRSNRDFTNQIVIYGMMDDFTDIAYQSFSTGLTTGTFPSNAAFYRDCWAIFYGGIYRANLAIKNIPLIEMSEKIKNRSIGEAKFFRGYYYFKLWDFYGGVPIYDYPMNFDEAYKVRNSEDEVYKFIVDDMTEAYSLLPEKYEGTDVGRVTKWAALAMRGKAHLWANQYDKAAADFKELMEKSDRKLVDNYHSLFRVMGNNNSEVILDIQYIAESGHGVATDVAYGSGMGPTKESQRTRPTNKLVESYETIDGKPFDYNNYKTKDGESFNPNDSIHWADNKETLIEIFNNRDLRLQQSVITPWSEFVGKGGQTYIYKYPIPKEADSEAFKPVWADNFAWRKFVETGSNYTLASNMPLNIPLIRLADVILMYAEAQNESKGADSSVYDAINKVRKRAGLPNLPTGLTKDEMREKIRHERMVELAGEGQRYSDIRRWKIAKDVVDKVWMTNFYGVQVRQRGFPDHYYLWPIPQQEVDLNPELIQNPGW